MFENIKSGWKLGMAVRNTVMKDKSLMVYPILSIIMSMILFIVIFVFSFVAVGAIKSPVYLVAIILFYIASTFTSTYISLVLLIAYKNFISENRISMKEAFAKARPYWKNALKWAIFYSIIIMILNIIESRFQGAGRMVIGFIGSMAISAAVFFVVPVILEKNVGPISAIKDSIKVIYSKFGKTFGGIAFIDLYSLIFVVTGILIMVASVILLGSFALLEMPLIITGVIGLILLIFGIIFASTMTQVLKLVIYDYANGGSLPEWIDKEILDGAIKKRRRF